MRAAIRTFICALFVGVPFSAVAEDLAVIFANANYSRFEDPPGIREVIGLQQDFQRAGFAVQVMRGTGKDVGVDQVEALWKRIKAADRLVVVFAGHILGSRDQTWMLHSDAGPVTALTIGREAIPIQPFYSMLGDRPGEAVLIVADAEGKIRKGPGLTDTPTIRRIPNGVTLVHGEARRVAQFIATELTRPGRTLKDAADNAPDGVRVAGFLSRRTGLAMDDQLTVPDASNEDQIWEETLRADTSAAYEFYLATYPFGRYAADAKQRLAELSLTPQDRARLAEEALQLNRDRRRAIQRDLTLLGFDTGGVDGVLGRNSRRAIARWQQSVGLDAFGYLTANQISRIEQAAAIRTEELRREAEERRQLEEARDRDYWARTGAGGSEEGLRDYLARYPDGLFAVEATDQLRAIERQRRREAREAERLAWDKAVLAGTIDSYEEYLNSYPSGSFADDARARIAALRQPEVPDDVVAAAREEEKRLGLTVVTRSLVERQLAALDLDTGKVDGKFTKKTRRSLRQFQRMNNVVPTGYVTRRTVVLLLASAAR